MGIRAILGLGNPGDKYENTRHNVGFKILDMLAEKHRGIWKRYNKNILITGIKFRKENVIICKPLTYMNNSGIAFMDLKDRFDIEYGEILVVLDDFNLDFGQLRIRKQGSDGGHNGLASIIFHSETTDFPRLRIGIGEPLSDSVDHVLGNFSKNEKEQLDDIFIRSVDAIEYILSNGIDQAMGIFNRKIPDNETKGGKNPNEGNALKTRHSNISNEGDGL